jgi:hypothetical protein
MSRSRFEQRASWTRINGVSLPVCSSLNVRDQVSHPYSPEDTYANLFRRILSINCWNVIKILSAVFEKFANMSFGVPIFGARLFIRTSATDLECTRTKLLHAEYEWNPPNLSRSSRAHMRNGLTDRMTIQELLFHTQGVNPWKPGGDFSFPSSQYFIISESKKSAISFCWTIKGVRKFGTICSNVAEY